MVDKNERKKGSGYAGGQHGKGRLFRRVGGRVWWIQYYILGRQIRESSRSDKKSVAEKLLMRRILAVEDGTHEPAKKPVSYAEMRQRFVMQRLSDDYDQKDIEYGLARLDEFFSDMSSGSITDDKVTEFKLAQKAKGISNATINRHLDVLRGLFKYSAKHILKPPVIKDLEEPPARQGFLTDAEWERLRFQLPPYLLPITVFAYATGARKEELAALTWKKVNLADSAIRLEPSDTKTGEGRDLHFGEIPELVELMTMLWKHRKGELVFSRTDGSPLGCFRKAWNRAAIKGGFGRMCWICKICKKLIDPDEQPWPPEEPTETAPTCACGHLCHWHYEGLIFHDLRRTAVRNLRRAGVPESIVMTISGHKSRDVFERYNIKDADDQRRAMKALREFREAEQRKTEPPNTRPN